MQISLIIYIWFVAILVLIISFLGLFMVRRNVITFLICLELLMFSINMILVSSSVYLNDIYGLLFSLFLLAITAAESSVGLAILILYYKKTYILSIDKLINIKA